MSLQLNHEQHQALQAILDFVQDDAQQVLILDGGAGTGKTTLIAETVRQFNDNKISYQLMAPTGRAARILDNKLVAAGVSREGSGCQTVHACIYGAPEIKVFRPAENDRIKTPRVQTVFPLRNAAAPWRVILLDEASLVGDVRHNTGNLSYGSGRLLHDLLRFARLGQKNQGSDTHVKLIFVGDRAQLPPVGEASSPAMDADYMRAEHGVSVSTLSLSQVMRQADDSEVLSQSGRVRAAVLQNQLKPLTQMEDGEEIFQLTPVAAVQRFVAARRKRIRSVIIAASNDDALAYNQSVRRQLWGEQLAGPVAGDWLLVTRNSYLHKLNNGDLVKIHNIAVQPERVRVALRGNQPPVYLQFRNVTLLYRQADGEITAVRGKILETLLSSKKADVDTRLHQAMLVHFMQRHPDLELGTTEFLLALQNDECYNALQVKYGYAMTCHKSQGGEWDEVLVDVPGSFNGRHSSTHFRWMYTAMTRSSQRLGLVGAKKFFTPDSNDWHRMLLEQQNVMAIAA